MTNIVTYIIIFIVFSVLGWIYEYHFFGKDLPDRVSNKIFGIDLAVLPIYGIGVMLLYYLATNYRSISLINRTIIATIIVTMFECVAGQMSYLFNGFKTWNYSDHYAPACSGYISIDTSLWWAILIFIGFYIFDHIKANN